MTKKEAKELIEKQCDEMTKILKEALKKLK